jgi:hypothetical protein
MDTNFLKAHADRCRSLAENADEFTKRRLLDLAANYDSGLELLEPHHLRACSKRRSISKTRQRNLSVSFQVGDRPRLPLRRDCKAKDKTVCAFLFSVSACSEHDARPIANVVTEARQAHGASPGLICFA